ncbi:hypothetical protein O9929_12905 [Vibrio lentus]|nr:hypothetical protein [Vibrio lentus]
MHRLEEGDTGCEWQGVSVVDVLTAGAHGVQRQITDVGVIDGENYPKTKSLGFC